MMKNFWLKSVTVIIIISMLLSVNVCAETLEKIDVVLNSGDVVEDEQYYTGRSEEFHPNYDPNFKDVNKVTFNAFGSEPIIVKAFGFAGWSAPTSVNEIVFNGTGDIILGSNAFAITNITELNLPSNIKFEDGACEVFYESKVKNVTIGCSMCEGMFYGCSSLETVTFTADNDISEIPKSAFDITGIEKIEIPSSVKKIGDSAFASSGLLEIKFNEGLETIGNSAFDTWGGFKKITLPSTVKSIGDKCFNSYNPYDIELNDGLESVGEQAFICKFANQSVKIPASVTEIGEYAFGYTFWKEKAENFTIYGYRGTAAETYADENGFTFIPLDSVTFERFEDATSTSAVYDVTVHSGAVVEEHQYAELLEEWSENHYWINKLTIDATKTAPITINDYGFAGANGAPGYIRTIEFIGSGDIVLGAQAFNFIGIESLTLPANVKFKENAEGVFTSCLRLKTVDIYCSLVPKMFDDCNSLETVNFRGNITSIPYAAFSTCNIKELDIPTSVEFIGEEAFYGNYQLSTVTLHNGLTSIGSKAFYDNSFKSVTIPASVTSIGEKAFGYISESETMDDFTIYGYRGTAAETYADENGFTFIPLDGESSVKDVAYTPSWSSVNDYSFTVDGRADKVQIIEATGATRTFTRNNGSVAIRGFDADGNEVSSLSRELDHEVWTLKTRLTPDSSLKIHAKYNNVWEDQMYYFSVSTLRSDTTLKSAELSEASGTQSSVDCKIVTGSGVNKVRIEYEDGMTTTVNSSAAVLDEANMTYTYNLSVKPRHSGENSFKVYIKTPSDGWIYATTLTYTAE